jgi:hypothetical protein
MSDSNAPPAEDCPRCGRKSWTDAAGFGTFRPEWVCGYCGQPAQESTPKGKE